MIKVLFVKLKLPSVLLRQNTATIVKIFNDEQFDTFVALENIQRPANIKKKKST